MTEALDLVDARIQDAVRDAMVADVPVGSYLSGGVDSSLVVAMASRLTDVPLHTFCASFGDARYDETPQARAVSELFGTDHHEVAVSSADFQDLWPRLTWNRDAPISEPADIAVFRLAEDARQHVKVALSGEGSDELFGGYPKYRFAGASVRAGLMPSAIRTPVLTTFERALPARANRLRIAARAMAAPSTTDRVTNWFAPFTTYEVARLLGGPVADPTRPSEYRDPIDLMCRMDLASWLTDNLLERGDRMSMAASLELRPPFLDHRLIETALRLPSSLKVRDGQTKWVLKAVAARYLPASITQRRKIGFRVPMDAWFREGLQDLSRDLLLSSDSLSSGILDRRVVAGLLDSHGSGRRNEESRIWTLLSLEQWARTCLYATGRPGPEDASCRSADRLQAVVPNIARPGVA
jgi:asparagine synthase (glutamine-hydrolysing)